MLLVPVVAGNVQGEAYFNDMPTMPFRTTSVYQEASTIHTVPFNAQTESASGSSTFSMHLSKFSDRRIHSYNGVYSWQTSENLYTPFESPIQKKTPFSLVSWQMPSILRKVFNQEEDMGISGNLSFADKKDYTGGRRNGRGDPGSNPIGTVTPVGNVLWLLIPALLYALLIFRKRRKASIRTT